MSVVNGLVKAVPYIIFDSGFKQIALLVAIFSFFLSKLAIQFTGMIGFLRRIRKSVIEEGQLRKYLFYAFGEILLVMIGILLALQVNNWNLSQQEIAEERASVERLLLDIEQNIEEFPGNLRRAEQGLLGTNGLFRMRDEVNPNRDSVEQHLESYLICSVFDPKTSEYESLKNSGGLRRLRNVEFRELLTENYEAYDYMSSIHISDCRTMSENILHVADLLKVDPRSSNQVNFDLSIKGDVKGLLENGKFMMGLTGQRNRRLVITRMTKNRMELLEKLKQQAITLLGEH